MTEIDEHFLFDGGEKLREAMKAHPELPIVFEADGDAYYTRYVSKDVGVSIGEVLTVNGPDENKTYFERDDLACDVFDKVWMEAPERDFISETTKDNVANEMKKYEEHWQKCIIVSIGE